MPRKNKNRKRGGFHTKIYKICVICLLILFTGRGIALAGGPFETPQPISKETGGLHTAIGYWFHEDKYENGTGHSIRQNQIYSEAGYAILNYGDVYARVGILDLEIGDAFSSSNALTIKSKNNFEEDWNLFVTLGVKGFYPINNYFGIGAFMQGSYYHFRKISDSVFGTYNGTPYITELEIKNLWDVNFGVGIQATVPYKVKLYIGPYTYYSEAKASSFSNVPSLQFAAGDAKIKNKTNVGGYTGVFIPLAKGFQLNVEGQYSEKFSAGAAITYTY